ncbi:hypothetical protein NW760_15488 [Fusarium oxysporum]|nr:hypothetical protein NW758_15323 [Fusarium oxysporum]KAJ4069893.1 hypothetical protein NW753_14597 [Fusarium oxysporum]KAJ4242040.1 hypothetical protein NW760_15488 [Fusarium oxysporum]
MNSAPGITDILNLMRRSGIRDAYRLLVLWAFGAHFNAKFRLVGPWAWEHAQGLLVSGEFWQTITRRPIIFDHFLFSILPMAIFHPLSLVFWIFHSIYACLVDMI